MQSFRCFDPYLVRFEPIPVLVVHTEASREMNFCTNGPMDRKSVKNCATVADMCQKPDNTAFRCSSRLASQANYWTRYASSERTKRLSNHTLGVASFLLPCPPIVLTPLLLICTALLLLSPAR